MSDSGDAERIILCLHPANVFFGEVEGVNQVFIYN